MSKFLAVAAAAVVPAVSLVALTPGVANAAAEYRADARLSGDRGCIESSGTTTQKVVLDNTKSNRKVQFKVSKTLTKAGDQQGGGTDFYMVGAGGKKIITLRIPEQMTMGLHVASPDMGRDWSRLTQVIESRPDCRKVVFDPRATLGGTTCQGADSVVQVNLDNRLSTDESAEYAIETAGWNRSSTTTVIVEPDTLRNTYVSMENGQTTDVVVTVGDEVLMERSLPARQCGDLS